MPHEELQQQAIEQAQRRANAANARAGAASASGAVGMRGAGAGGERKVVLSSNRGGDGVGLKQREYRQGLDADGWPLCIYCGGAVGSVAEAPVRAGEAARSKTGVSCMACMWSALLWTGEVSAGVPT